VYVFKPRLAYIIAIMLLKKRVTSACIGALAASACQCETACLYEAI
jgi:hypothetical protein